MSCPANAAACTGAMNIAVRNWIQERQALRYVLAQEGQRKASRGQGDKGD